MPRRAAFPAGMILDAHKQQALGAPLRAVPEPAVAFVSLDQGSGYSATPLVAAGERVRVGTIIARDPEGYAATLHAPIAGHVRSVERLEAATDSGWNLCVVIENDGTATRDPRTQPPSAATFDDPLALIEAIREAGIAGLGGAAFPAATKLRAAREHQATHLVLNGAECEPWICCDDALLREQADDVAHGARLLMRALQAQQCSIAIEDDKPEAIAALRAALARDNETPLDLVVVPAVYPRGAERQLITAVTGLEVPTRKLPATVGVTCQNVATAAAIAQWARTGEPCVSRVVTVTGGAMATPCNVIARIGTPLHEIINSAGGYRGTPHRLIAGGSMTGRAVATDAIGLTKAMNCVFAASFEDLQSRALAREVPCIRCGDCASVCPAGLLPQQLHRAALVRDTGTLASLGIMDCIECGCCDYVCPSQIPLTERFRAARIEQRVLEVETRRAAAARERYERHEQRLRAQALEEQRAFDAAREAARAAAANARPDATDEHSTGRNP
jgi:Na+-translocating ferredoxin:NAD+ oxidoreductase subunit C